jgi:hypothetical protein
VTNVAVSQGLWRLTLHNRAFASNLTMSDLFIAEIANARSIKVEQSINKSSTLSFAIDGTSPAASLIRELEHDVVCWRWDEQTGKDLPVIRGIVAQSQDTLSEQADTVTFTCHDYLAMLERRLITYARTYTQTDQDTIATNLIEVGAKAVDSTNRATHFSPGSYLPLTVATVNPDGAPRGLSGVLRDRPYLGQEQVFEMLDNLANVEGGFDYDVLPSMTGDDKLRVFYPYQGIIKTSLVLEYGSTVSALSRSVNSGNYANLVRAVGDKSNPNDSNSPPLFAEAWDTNANNVVEAPQGLWMAGDNASDVKVQATLTEKAKGDLASSGVLLPSYSLTLRPGFYKWGSPNMGDVVRLVINAGRLNVDTDVQIVAMTYDANEDGGEVVTVGLGRPDVNFGDLLTVASRDVNALARR